MAKQQHGGFALIIAGGLLPALPMHLGYFYRSNIQLKPQITYVEGQFCREKVRKKSALVTGKHTI